VNIGPASDAPFGNELAFLDFLVNNEIAHIAFGDAIARQQGRAISAILPIGNPKESPDWLNDHWNRHSEECALLGIAVPDLSGVDLSNESQYLDWMLLHCQVHQQQNLALGITT
jgi:hypothetical protein